MVAQRLTNSRLEGVRRRVYRQSESDMHLVRYFPVANSPIFSTNWVPTPLHFSVNGLKFSYIFPILGPGTYLPTPS